MYHFNECLHTYKSLKGEGVSPLYIIIYGPLPVKKNYKSVANAMCEKRNG
jgi:hypothetical protein